MTETEVLRAGDAELHVALLGATPLRWLVPHGDAPWDLLDGYRDDAELADQNGVRNGIMAPFCNRVADARYTFDGVEHDLAPGATDRTVYHGLVRTLPFEVVERTDAGTQEAGVHASLRLRCTGLAGSAAVGYPFSVVVEVTYTLGPRTLAVEITGHNVGDVAAPYASGWHPYFRLPGTARVDDLDLDVPASVAVRTDDALLPLAGADAFADVDAPAWHPLGDAVLDAAFGGLDPALPTVVRDPAGTRLVLRQDRGLVHVFTGDTLARDRRASLAVEPVEVMTDAFNRPDQAAAIRLEPGERRSFGFVVELEPVLA
ncbi:aldose 1-epimerase [Cellulomonas cellasea]|uniref:Aldose 1-epimerase n=1 Tax=Cellulomonas cellasea TaxID=43670 RepID=A0A7W4UFU4_9CELL|nr:aldose 1-epimerase [Cellulomonas cellasea]MBB2922788.1 aldose 1-epimerase [Cellulomonas cellasea]